MLKTKIRVTALVALVVAAAGMYYLRLPNELSNGRDKRGMQISVNFEPKTRPPRVKNDPFDPTVQIKVYVDGHLVEDHEAIDSPWLRLIDLPRGSLLELVASQQIGAELHCVFKTGGQVVEQESAAGALAKVKCTYIEEG